MNALRWHAVIGDAVGAVGLLEACRSLWVVGCGSVLVVSGSDGHM